MTTIIRVLFLTVVLAGGIAGAASAAPVNNAPAPVQQDNTAGWVNG